MQGFGVNSLVAAAVFAVTPVSIGHAADNNASFAESDASVVLLEGDILSEAQPAHRGIGTSKRIERWIDGLVPYHFDPELPMHSAVIVQSAIDSWNDVAGITLVEIDPNAADAPEDYLYFKPAGTCASWVGRQGGAQAIWTGENCRHGNMVHEIGHALGLEHEHTRSDRDQHITIDWDNIADGKENNFAVRESHASNYGPYDYKSIMHYGNYFFSKNGKQTITPIAGNTVAIGQRVAPSDGDTQAISDMYQTDLSLVSHVETVEQSSEVSLLVTNEHTQGANMLELSMTIGDAQLLSNENSEWFCFAYDDTLNCSRDRLSGNAQSSLVLIFDRQLEESELNPTLTSNTPDANTHNNSGEFSPEAALNAQQITPLSDELTTANVGATGYSLSGLFMIFLLRLRSRRGEK